MHRSKHLNEFLGKGLNYVVAVCDRAKETCPIVPDACTVLHWSSDDPVSAEKAEEERRAVFRRVRDESVWRIRQFLDGAQ